MLARFGMMRSADDAECHRAARCRDERSFHLLCRFFFFFLFFSLDLLEICNWRSRYSGAAREEMIPPVGLFLRKD